MLRKLCVMILSVFLTKSSNFCPWGNNPVCGVDMITYKNQCALTAAYVELDHFGACTKIKTITGVENVIN